MFDDITGGKFQDFRCSGHEETIRSIAAMERTEQAMIEALAEIKAMYRSMTEALRNIQREQENYVDRRIERQDVLNREAFVALETRLSKRIDELASSIKEIPARLMELERFKGEQEGETRAERAARALKPKWATVLIALVAILVSTATTLVVAFFSR